MSLPYGFLSKHLTKPNILLDFSELADGIQLLNKDGEKVGSSQVAAKRAIGQVVFSRIAMAAPGEITFFETKKGIHFPMQIKRFFFPKA